MSNNRTYATALTSTINNVDFSQVYESAESTVRKSLDNSQFVLKWEITQTPDFIVNGTVTTTWTGSHEDCLTLMATPSWTNTGSI
jgi:hypothetical protein